MGWFVAIIFQSHIYKAIIETFLGHFAMAKQAVDYQWLLFFPSIYVFAIWDSYNDAVETNKLFAEQQKNYLRKVYGSKKLAEMQKPEG